MGKVCAVCGKTWRNRENLRFFLVPKDEDRRKQWSERCGIETFKKGASLCQNHFKQCDFINAPGSPHTKIVRLRHTAVPSLFMTTIRQQTSSERSRHNAWFDNLLEAGIKVSVSCSTQTEEETIKSQETLYIKDLDRKLKLLLTAYQKEKEEHKCLTTALENIFTKNQIKKLRNPHADICWTFEDMSNAMNLCDAGSKTYKYLQKIGYPLPCLEALLAWEEKMKTDEKLLYIAIEPAQIREVNKIYPPLEETEIEMD